MSSSVDTFSTRLSILKSQLVFERNFMKRRKVEENRHELQKQTETRNTTWNQPVEGENPDQILFPEEIWLEIFDRLSIRDVQNCYYTCHLFQSHLQPLRNQIKFGAVLPILVQTRYLIISDLLACRQVCKLWRDWVDKWLENQPVWFEEGVRGTRRGIGLCSAFLAQSGYRIKDEQLAHVNNPLVGRRVQLKSFPEYSNYSHTYITITPEEWFSNTTPNATCLRNARILETVGKHIHHLFMEGDMIKMLKTRFLENLNNCSDLKSLQIINHLDSEDSYIKMSYKEKYEELANALPLPLLKLKSLQKLKLRTLYRRSENEIDFGANLVQQFSAQLKEFQVDNWLSDYSNCSWKELTKLTLKVYDSKELLESIGKLKADKLHYLCIRFYQSNQSQTNWLEVLLKIFQNFKQLTHVNLNFECAYDKWSLSEEQVVELWDKCSHLCSTSITNITLVIDPDVITYSFLVFFPNLQKLTTNADDSPKVSVPSTNLLELKDNLSPKNFNLYSVVWHILPFLRSITIIYGSYCTVGRSRTFIRKPGKTLKM